MSAVTPEINLPRLEHVGRVTQMRVAVSEWTKLHSLRSTRWSFLVAIVLTIGFSALFAAVTSSHWGSMSPHDRAGRSPLETAQGGINVSQLAVMVLGVLVITGEYSTGMIRASMTAVPKRLPVLWAKLGVFGIATFLLMLPSVVASFFITQAILGRHDILQISFTHPGVARAVIGGAIFLTMVGMFSLAIGAIVRNTAGGIATVFGLFFVIPPLLNVFPTSWQNSINPYIPNSAGRSIFQLTHGSHSLSPWGGFALFAVYTAVAIAIAAVLLVRRDT
jgi:ABC-type transport system involved in multi-copper enzyme maturation permease subunit